MDVARFPEVIGRQFPGGSYFISVDENRRLCRAIGTEPAADGLAHPVYAYVATQSGMGLSVDELLALAECKAADGPMLGSSRTVFRQPLRVDTTYLVRGHVANLTRKKSRTIGTMDLLEFRLSLAHPDGGEVLEIANVWILPRGEHG